MLPATGKRNGCLRRFPAAVAAASAWRLVVAPVSAASVAALPTLIGARWFAAFTLCLAAQSLVSFLDCGYAVILRHKLSRLTPETPEWYRATAAAYTVRTAAAAAVASAGLLILAVHAVHAVNALSTAAALPSAAVLGCGALLLSAIPATVADTALQVVECRLTFNRYGLLRAALSLAGYPAAALGAGCAWAVHGTRPERFLAAAATVLAARCILAAVAYRTACGKGCVVGFCRFSRKRPVHLLRSVANDVKRYRWFVVVHALSPLFGEAPRYTLALFATSADVAYYSLSYDLLQRLCFASESAASVYFVTAGRRPHDTRLKWHALVTSVALALLPAAAVLGTLQAVAFLNPHLHTTPATGFAAAQNPLVTRLAAKVHRFVSVWRSGGATVTAVLCTGFVIRAAARIHQLHLYHLSCFKNVALLHVAEAVPYVAALVLATQKYAALGAASTWTAHVVFSCCAYVAILRQRKGNTVSDAAQK